MFPLASTHATLVVRHRKNPVDSERQCVPSGSLTSAAEVELHAEIRHAASTTTSAQENSRFQSDIRRRNAARKVQKPGAMKKALPYQTYSPTWPDAREIVRKRWPGKTGFSGGCRHCV